MKKLFTLVCTLLLGATLSFAVPQDTGDKGKPAKTETKGDKGGKKGHKGGKKHKKGEGTTTTPPPK